jgi:hypothetical protein
METTMAQIQQNGSNSTGNYYQGTSTKNNGGAAIAGGSTPALLSKRAPKGVNVGVSGSVVVQSNLLGNTKALSAGTFSHAHIKPLTARVTTELGGVNTSALSKTSNVVTRSINKTESVITNKTATAFRAGFNLFTGQYSGAVTTTTDSLGSDVAANPTTSSPGRLTYMIGKKVPTRTSYKAKTN